MPLNEQDGITIIAALRAIREKVDTIKAEAEKINVELVKILNDLRD